MLLTMNNNNKSITSMRKRIVRLLIATLQLLAFRGANAKAGCITLNEQSRAGILGSQVCLTGWG